MSRLSSNGSFRWQVRYDPIAPAEARLSKNRRQRAAQTKARVSGTVRFGRSGSALFFVTADSKGDSFATISSSGSGSVILMYNPRTRAQKRIRIANNRFNGTAPFVLQGPNGLDVFALVTKTASATQIKFRGVRGQNLGNTTLPGTGDIITGNFLPDYTGDEIAVQNASGFTIYNPFTTQSLTLANVSGIPVDDANTNYFASSASTCKSTSAFTSSYIYKTVGSNHFSAIDPRRKSIGFLVKSGVAGSYPSCITAIDSLGNVVAKLGLYAKGSGWSARYYAGVGCGSSTPYGGSTVAARARASSGKSDVLFNFGGKCIGPQPAENCKNSSSC